SLQQTTRFSQPGSGKIPQPQVMTSPAGRTQSHKATAGEDFAVFAVFTGNLQRRLGQGPQESSIFRDLVNHKTAGLCKFSSGLNLIWRNAMTLLFSHRFANMSIGNIVPSTRFRTSARFCPLQTRPHSRMTMSEWRFIR